MICGGYHIDIRKLVKTNVGLMATVSDTKKAYELLNDQYNDYMNANRELIGAEQELAVRKKAAVTNANRYPAKPIMGSESGDMFLCMEPISKQRFYANDLMLREAMAVINEERTNGLDTNVAYDLFLRQFHLQRLTRYEIILYPLILREV